MDFYFTLECLNCVDPFSTPIGLKWRGEVEKVLIKSYSNKLCKFYLLEEYDSRLSLLSNQD